MGVINGSTDAVAPFVIKTVRRSPAPWINDILRAITDRNGTLKALRNNRLDVALQADYKQKRNVESVIQGAKPDYFRNK